MSKFIKAALASSVLAASVMGANAAHAATASADARATILEQVTVTNTSDLDFATIVTGATAGTVVVDAAGAVTCAAALVCSGTTTAAGFSVAGTTGQTVDIDADATVTLTNGGGNAMVATLVESATTLTISGTAANDVFTVGGSLAVGANQADGAYLGNFDVTVNYQ
ncbi:DUF4402 domain-containing protein [Parasphingorhabdus sp.]|jgi:Mat/Ecp fimbriae major subunit|uniref:DUF4402 domain-containing protein n=1 Tax=Parasphingorhabdus sp. TaxID=2709688 RepID=UPI003BAF23E9